MYPALTIIFKVAFVCGAGICLSGSFAGFADLVKNRGTGRDLLFGWGVTLLMFLMFYLFGFAYLSVDIIMALKG